MNAKRKSVKIPASHDEAVLQAQEGVLLQNMDEVDLQHAVYKKSKSKTSEPVYQVIWIDTDTKKVHHVKASMETANLLYEIIRDCERASSITMRRFPYAGE